MMKSVGNLGEQNQYMQQYNNPPRIYSQTYQNITPNNVDMNANINTNTNNMNNINNFSESRSYYEENKNYNNYNGSNQMRSDLMNIDEMN